MRSYEDLQYRLSDAEREQYERDGYFIVKNALPEAQLLKLQNIFDNEMAVVDFDTEHDLIPNELLAIPEYLDIIDQPQCFHKIHDLMSCNIQLHMYRGHAKKRGGNWDSWHRDNNDLGLDLKNDSIPHLSAKVAYFLSDMSETGRGNLSIAPGSQHIEELALDEAGEPEHEVSVCGNPGDAIIFDARLWHTPTNNESDIMRKIIFIAYSYRWLRQKIAPVDDVQQSYY
ncbi:MAG: phytanoyl-CoA dioxygenase family protein [Planctomycetes bacterium]|nr:phytanoyl-CoA dioxygenase family protein [Planctomycetota bacterium]